MTNPTGALPGVEAATAVSRVPPRVAGYEIEEELQAALTSGGRPMRIAGVDEVGRGAWAGPVVVCAALIPARLISATRIAIT